MATLHDGAPPRKKLITYGKSARKRIPDFAGFNALDKPTLREPTPKPDTFAPMSASPPSYTSTQSKPLRQRSKTPAIAPPPKSKALDVSGSDGESPVRVHKKLATPPNLKAPIRAATKSPATKTMSPKKVYDCPESGEEIVKPAKKTPPTPKRRQKAKPPLQPTFSHTSPTKPTPTKPTVFDFPESEDDTPKLVRKASPLRKPQPKLKPDIQAPVASTAAPKSPVKRSIYDISSEEESIVVAPRPTKTKQAISNLDAKVKSSNTQLSAIADEGKRKKLKLSTVKDLSGRPATTNKPTSPKPKPRAMSKPPRPVNTSPKNKPVAKMGAKPVQELPIRRQERQLTPLKLHSPPSFEDTDLDMIIEPGASGDKMDLDPKVSKHMSRQAKKLWQNILDPDDDSVKDTGDKMDFQMDSRSLQGSSSARLQANLVEDTEFSKPAPKAQSNPPRKRLIDTLVQQIVVSDSSESEESDSEDSEPSSSPQIPPPPVPTFATSKSQSAAPEPMSMASDSQASQISQVPGLRTYSRQRSMLQEADLMKELALGLPSQPAEGSRRNRRGSIPTLKPLTSFQEEEEEENTLQLKSVHELRKAGANNRFLYEVQDAIDSIGAPEKTTSSLRRSGLVDLASKMKDKEFAKEFRAHSMELRLFVHLGQEKDMVAGFLIVSILVLMLSEGPMPHIVAHLRRQGITRLIIRLLDCQSGIAAVCKDRKTNMSGAARSLVVEHHDSLLKLSIWDDLEPQILSPRTLALKCLELMVRQTRAAKNEGDLFSSKDLATKLFTILKSASEEETWNLPQGKEAIDFYLALATLEKHSLAARTAHDEAIWLSDYLPTLASTLSLAISRPLETSGPIQLLILQMCIQVTTENVAATAIFEQPSLLALIGSNIVSQFHKISRWLREDDFQDVVNNLTLLLALMMNIADTETGPQVLCSLERSGSDPLDRILAVFGEFEKRSNDSDNQAGQRNVVFGWLSCMLGYFYLHPSIATRFDASHPRHSSRPLIESIGRFIEIHKRADAEEMMDVDEEGGSRGTMRGFTERMESLVVRLEGRS